MFPFISLVSVALATAAAAQHYSATYLPSNAPKQSEQGQAGTNQCGTGSDQNSLCQNAYVNSVDDFCVFAPPQPGPGSVIGNTERIEVAWCIKSGYGTRLIPDGTITGAHFVQTPDYVQVTGVGDLTKINIPAGDEGGELDPHGADGNGNPIGGLVFSNAFGSLAQIHEWTNFVSDSQFCFRACKDGPNAPALCQHIYDVMGCFWNMPGNYDAGSFERCEADTGEPMGVYGTSTFHQGDPSTPAAHPAPSSSDCTSFSTISNGLAASAPTTTISSISSATSVSATSTVVTTSQTSSGVTTTSASPSAPSSSSVPTSTSMATTTSSSATSGVSQTSSSNTASVTPLGTSTTHSTGSSSSSGSTSSTSTQTASGNNNTNAGTRASFGWQLLLAACAITVVL